MQKGRERVKDLGVVLGPLHPVVAENIDVLKSIGAAGGETKTRVDRSSSRSGPTWWCMARPWPAACPSARCAAGRISCNAPIPAIPCAWPIRPCQNPNFGARKANPSFPPPSVISPPLSPSFPHPPPSFPHPPPSFPHPSPSFPHPPPSSRSRTPLRHSRTPLRHSRTPLRHSRTPLRHSRTPLRHSRTPLRHSRTPLRHSRESGNPGVLEGSPRAVSPLHPAWIPAFAGMTISGGLCLAGMDLGWAAPLMSCVSCASFFVGFKGIQDALLRHGSYLEQ